MLRIADTEKFPSDRKTQTAILRPRYNRGSHMNASRNRSSSGVSAWTHPTCEVSPGGLLEHTFRAPVVTLRWSVVGYVVFDDRTHRPRVARALDCIALNDKHILITGATNGIGLAAAEALAALGAKLAIVGRSKTRTRIASENDTGKNAANFRSAVENQQLLLCGSCVQLMGDLAPRFFVAVAVMMHGHASSCSFARLRRRGRSIGPLRLNRNGPRVPRPKRKPRGSGAR